MEGPREMWSEGRSPDETRHAESSTFPQRREDHAVSWGPVDTGHKGFREGSVGTGGVRHRCLDDVTAERDESECSEDAIVLSAEDEDSNSPGNTVR